MIHFRCNKPLLHLSMQQRKFISSSKKQKKNLVGIFFGCTWIIASISEKNHVQSALSRVTQLTRLATENKLLWQLSFMLPKHAVQSWLKFLMITVQESQVTWRDVCIKSI